MKVGITPARAGKSNLIVAGGNLQWNYPRSRGEKNTVPTSFPFCEELPPLARGKAVWVGIGQVCIGITPARAGKRCRARFLFTNRRNYPRSRGEKRTNPDAWFPDTELPPLARGKEEKKQHGHPTTGITPARAGKSLNDLRFWASVSFFHAGSYLTVCRLQGAYLCLVTHHLSSPTQPLTLASVSSFCGLVLQLRPG